MIDIAGVAAAQTKPSASAPAASQPSNVVGWRTDGTGRYPDAKPPTEWFVKENGESKNILWKTKLPCYTWATPVIVGDKLFTRSEPYDLICMDKNSGKLLWIRSHPPFVAIPDEVKKANGASDEIRVLVTDLQKVNDDFVKQGWKEDLFKKKVDLQKKINDLTAKIDKKYAMPPDMWQESWAGYTGETPVSDGKNVYITSGAGVTAAYDLDGKLLWTRFESRATGWGEHGNANSPTVVGDKLILYNAMAVNTKDGKEIWTAKLTPVEHGGSYAVVPFKIGGQDFVAIHNQFIRVSDGKNMYSASIFTGTPPVVVNGTDLFYIRMTWGVAGFHCELAGENGLKVTVLPSTDLPVDPATKWDPGKNFYTAPALYHDGLLYVVGNWGKFSVVDPAKGEVVYTKDKPFDFRNKFSRFTAGCGIGSAPFLAGKYIYMIDNAGCTLVLEPGREFKQVAKNNIDYTITAPWGPNYYDTPHHEVTLATPVVNSNRIYIRGEQFMYCIGEK